MTTMALMLALTGGSGSGERLRSDTLGSFGDTSDTASIAVNGSEITI